MTQRSSRPEADPFGDPHEAKTFLQKVPSHIHAACLIDSICTKLKPSQNELRVCLPMGRQMTGAPATGQEAEPSRLLRVNVSTRKRDRV